jgi:hypothetical protein
VLVFRWKQKPLTSQGRIFTSILHTFSGRQESKQEESRDSRPVGPIS